MDEKFIREYINVGNQFIFDSEHTVYVIIDVDYENEYISWSWVEDGIYHSYDGFTYNNGSPYNFETLHAAILHRDCKLVGTNGNPKKKLSKLTL